MTDKKDYLTQEELGEVFESAEEADKYDNE